MKRYANIHQNFSIEAEVKNNLEIIEEILQLNPEYAKYLEVRMYDSFPSICIYRVHNYLLRGTFLHTRLAIDSSQLELDLTAEDRLLANETMNDFERIWEMGKDFTLALMYPNWNSALNTLF